MTGKVGSPPGPRPWLWVTGTDEVLHKKYRAWIQQKNQANYRKETWTLEFDDWVELWGDKWDLRGRKTEQYCLTRISYFDDWTKENSCVITRKEHAIAIGKFKQTKKLLKQLEEIKKKESNA